MADQRPIGFWLKLVDRLIDEQFAATLEEHGVTRRQWQLLNALSVNPATATQLDAALEPFLDTAAGESSADHLGELIESEWVVLNDDRYDLTERGMTAFSRLSEVVNDNRAAVTKDVSEEEYSATIDVLERLARNLGWSE